MIINESLGYKFFKIFNISFMLLICLVVLFPYINVLAVALNDSSKTTYSGLMFIPKVWTFANFQTLFMDNIIKNAIVITFLRLVLGVILALALEFSAAYVLTKKFLPGRKALTIYMMIPMYISGGLIPMYILFSRIHLLNNFLVYILPSAFSFYNVLIMRTYLYTIPDSLEESAKLDGANEFVILWKVFFPLSAPIIATIALFQSVYHWNDWVTTLYFVTNYKLYTLQYVLTEILLQYERLAKLVQAAITQGLVPSASQTTSQGIRAAQIIVTTLPIILVYPFFQRYFIKGILIGGVKE